MTDLASPTGRLATYPPAPASLPSTDLAVVGAGAAATLLLAQLRRRWVGDLPRTTLVEKGRCPGPGIAYRTDDPRHRMNVRICQLTAFPDEPDHLLAWVRRYDADATADDYVPRSWFGRYLSEVLDESTSAPSPITRCQTEVTSVVPGGAAGGGGLLLTDRSGPFLRADHVVLATGVPPTGSCRFEVDPGLDGTPGYVEDPWGSPGLGAAASANRVVLVGTGLTMVDVALSLLERHGVREVLSVSTTGRLPEPHREVRSLASRPVGRPSEATARGVVAWLRQVCADEPAGWEAAVDAVRWASPDIWAALPLAEQARLLRLTGSRWSRLRHRMPPAVAAQIATLRRTGRLRICAGRVRGVRRGEDGVVVDVSRRHAADLVLRADAVVNCSGPPGVWATTDPVIRQLVDSGSVGVGPHGLGLAVANDGAVLDPAGVNVPGLSLLGALRRGTEFEATAVPELRAQAERLVPRLARRLAGHR